MAAALITFKIFIQKKYEPEPKEYRCPSHELIYMYPPKMFQ